MHATEMQLASQVFLTAAEATT